MQLQNLLVGIENYIIANEIVPEDWTLATTDYQETFNWMICCKEESVGEFQDQIFAQAILDMLIDCTYRTRQWSTINLTKAGDAAIAFLKENPTFLTDVMKEPTSNN